MFYVVCTIYIYMMPPRPVFKSQARRHKSCQVGFKVKWHHARGNRCWNRTSVERKTLTKAARHTLTPNHAVLWPLSGSASLATTQLLQRQLCESSHQRKRVRLRSASPPHARGVFAYQGNVRPFGMRTTHVGALALNSQWRKIQPTIQQSCRFLPWFSKLTEIQITQINMRRRLVRGFSTTSSKSWRKVWEPGQGRIAWQSWRPGAWVPGLLQQVRGLLQAERPGFPISPLDADPLLADFLDLLYLDGKSASEGEKTVAALEFHQIALKGHLPRSKRALRGWRKAVPPSSRLPMPRPVMFGLAMNLLFTFTCAREKDWTWERRM